MLHMRCLILGVKRHFSPRLFVINLDYKLATLTIWLCTLSGESSIKVGQANVRVKAVDSQDNHIVEIKNVKVVDNLNITTARAKDLSKWPHLKDLEINR